jgi:hypothetical protein
MIIADTTNNGCSAESHGQPIGVRCECGHRSLIPLERIGARGSMNRLCDLKLKCAQCGGRKFEIVLFFNGAQADLRLYGQDLNEWPAKMYRDDPNPFRSSGE